MKTHVLDTHALVWRLTNDRRLGAQAAAVLEEPDAILIFPVIVLAEIKNLAHKRRLTTTRERVLTVIEADGRCVIRTIDLEIIRAMPIELDIHDALIVGAALTHVTPVDGVLTCDQDIIRAGLVPVIG